MTATQRPHEADTSLEDEVSEQLSKKYPNMKGGGVGSSLLQRRLENRNHYFDSADYNMEQAKRMTSRAIANKGQTSGVAMMTTDGAVVVCNEQSPVALPATPDLDCVDAEVSSAPFSVPAGDRVGAARPSDDSLPSAASSAECLARPPPCHASLNSEKQQEMREGPVSFSFSPPPTCSEFDSIIHQRRVSLPRKLPESGDLRATVLASRRHTSSNMKQIPACAASGTSVAPLSPPASPDSRHSQQHRHRLHHQSSSPDAGAARRGAVGGNAAGEGATGGPWFSRLDKLSMIRSHSTVIPPSPSQLRALHNLAVISSDRTTEGIAGLTSSGGGTLLAAPILSLEERLRYRGLASEAQLKKTSSLLCQND